MEVTPEIYAWLINLNVIDGNKSMNMKHDGNIILSDSLSDQLFKGSQIDRILISMQEGYNNFYKIKINYLDKIKDLKQLNDNQTVSNSIRYQNWKIIADVLKNFGIDLDDDKISKISIGSKTILLNLLKQIYTLNSEVTKRSIEMDNGASGVAEATELIVASSANDIKKMNYNKIKKLPDAIDINTFDTNKEYKDCRSPLEFFIVSLCKALSMKPRQAVALLSNNRKYLIHICNKGIKGEFDKISSWYDDLTLNSRVMTSLLKTAKDGKAMGFATLSVGLYSKNFYIARAAAVMINQLQVDIEGDWDWFTKEGIDTIIFAINKHPELRISMLNLLYEFSSERTDDLIKCLQSKLPEKDKLLDFLSSIVTNIKDTNPSLLPKLKKFLIEFCLKETSDKCMSISILSDALIYLPQLETNYSNAILNFLKKGIREKGKKNIQCAALAHFFRILKHLGNLKNTTAPSIYKTLVFLFLENYDDIILRELFLINFTILFKSHPTIPIILLLDPYFRQLKSTPNYNLSDFQFLTALVEHPRVDFEIVKEVLEFILNVCLLNINYTRTANLIFHLLVDKNLINFNDEILIQICATFINKALGYFTLNVKSRIIDVTILETPYDIVSLETPEINQRVHQDVIEAVKFYRGDLNHHSSGLLALLYTYEDHDEVILNLEEKYAERYELVEAVNEKKDKKRVQEFRMSPAYIIDKIKQKRAQEENIKSEELQANRIRQGRIKKTLEKQLEQKAFELGMLNSSNVNNLTMLNAENKTLILKEGSFINDKENTLKNITKNLILPIMLHDEEDRERKAIEGYIKQYKKQINFYFYSYLTEINNTVTKANVLKMVRDIGITNDLINIEELSLAIRNIFGTPLNNFNKDTFLSLMIQCSFLIFTKVKINLSISECFENLLKLFKIQKSKEGLKKVNKEKKILILLKEKLNTKNDEPTSIEGEEDIVNTGLKLNNNTSKNDILLPPGFKKINRTTVLFDYKLPSSFIKFLPESKIICLELVNEIVNKMTGSNLIEPIVKVNKELDIIYDTADPNYRNWGSSIVLAYTGLDKSLEKEGRDSADLLEEMLKAVEKGRTSLEKTKIIPPLEKMEKESYLKFIEEEKAKDRARKLRKQMVMKQLTSLKATKDDQSNKREEEIKKKKLEKEEKLKKQLLIEREIRKQTKNKIVVEKKQKEEEKTNKEKQEKEKKEIVIKKKDAEKQVFFKKQHRKLKEQFTTIKDVKNEFAKKHNEIIMASIKLPEVNIKKLLDKDKSYVEFEKNLNNILEDFLKKPQIAEVFSKYENHLKVIYDIYYKMSSKLSSYAEEYMHLNEFKQFCLNFTILGLLITNEQMIYLFRKLCKRNEGEKEESVFIRHKDFVLSILYLSIMSKFTSKSRRILPSDLEATDKNTVQSFFNFLGLNTPFNKKELEEFINDRRALSAKQLSRLQQQIKKDKVVLVKKEEPDINMKPKLLKNKLLRRKEENKKNEKSINDKSIADVDVSKLQTDDEKLKIVDPKGKPENWQVKK